MGAADVLRARAVYMLGWVFIFSQLINLALMSYAYGEWTLDHWIASTAIVVIFIAIHFLRWTKAFKGFAAFYSLLMLLGVLAASLPGQMGIHSAMLPLLVAGAVINGFISDWRMVAIYAFSSLAIVWYLYNATLGWPAPPGIDPATYQTRAFMRAVQTTIAFSVVSAGLAVFSVSMQHMINLLEENIRLAQNADMAKTNFLANMSHELRTPLNGVIGMAGLLKRTEMTSTQENYVNIIDGCSTGLVTIINDVLDLSKLDAGKAEFHFSPFDFKAMLDSLVALNRPAAIDKGLLLELHWPETVPERIISDESRLRQIANNLIGNAVKFTAEGRIDVMVQCRPIKTHDGLIEICLFVRDTGVGIPEEDVDRVFKRFEQVDNRLSSTTTGTGLGLAITQNLVEKLGGQIHLQSNLGEGTIFTVQMPVREDRRAFSPEMLGSNAVNNSVKLSLAS